MFVITNRVLDETRTDLRLSGNDPNPSGPNELRMVFVEVTQNSTLKRMSSRVFEGGKAETAMEFHPDTNLYRT